MKAAVVAALVALTLTACGTLQNGPVQRIHVASEPAGATVTADSCGVVGEKKQETPAVFFVSRRAKNCTLRVAMDDYFPASIVLRRERSPNAADNLTPLRELCAPDVAECDDFTDVAVFGALGATFAGLGYGVDYATGGLYQQTPSRINVQLKPRFTPEEAAGEADIADNSRK